MGTLKWMLLVFTIAIFSGCTTQKKCFKKFPPPPPSTDKVVEKITEYRDTTIYVYIQADTVYKTDTLIIGEDGLINYPLQRLDTKFAYSTFQIVNSRLDHKLYQKESTIAETIEKAIKEKSYVETLVVKEPYPVPAKISWWNQTLIRLGYVLLVLIVATIVLFIIKKKVF